MNYQRGVAEVVAALELSKRDQVLFSLFELERQGGKSFSVKEIEALFDSLRLPPPANTRRDLRELSTKRLVMRTSENWQLSHAGYVTVEGWLRGAGFLEEGAGAGEIEPLRRVSASLKLLLERIDGTCMKSIVSEALRCVEPAVGALRAAVVLGWAAGVARLRTRLWSLGPNVLGQEIARQKWRYTIRKEDDLDNLKDSNLLVLCHELGLFDKAALKALTNALDVRNSAAHPTDVVPGVHKVEAFFEDLFALMYV